jgi:beta-N-acetylhexosaminidase
VTLNIPLASLRSVDELPYTSAIAAAVKLVMVSWAIYPALDPRSPAGLSATVVQHELRGRLGFNGVTITDALEAGALAAYGSTSSRALLAARAEMDLILCSSQDVTQATAAVDALASALSSGALAKISFNTSVSRVIALRQSLGS